MLSRKTLRVISLDHVLGVLFGVIPFKFNVWNLGINGTCELVYFGLYWEWNVTFQILMRLLVAGYMFWSMFFSTVMMPVDVGIVTFCIVVLVTSARLLCFYRSFAEEFVQFQNQFLRLNQHMGKRNFFF